MYRDTLTTHTLDEYQVYALIIIIPVNTVSSSHNPAFLNQGSSTCVVISATRQVLKRDLRIGKTDQRCVYAISQNYEFDIIDLF